MTKDDLQDLKDLNEQLEKYLRECAADRRDLQEEVSKLKQRLARFSFTIYDMKQVLLDIEDYAWHACSCPKHSTIDSECDCGYSALLARADKFLQHKRNYR